MNLYQELLDLVDKYVKRPVNGKSRNSWVEALGADLDRLRRKY